MILTVVGLTGSPAVKTKAAGINVDLWTGLGMLVFGVLILVWAFARPLRPDPESRGPAVFAAHRRRSLSPTVPETVTAFAPGRVNLIGEHTDYNGGLALPFAIERGVTVTATPLPGGRHIVARASDLGEDDMFDAGDPKPTGGWAAFVRGAVGELGRAGVRVPGAHVTITGDLPQGGGLSSSAALEVALTLALAELAGGGEAIADPILHARLCARIEHRWVGADTGLLDQLASILGRAGHAQRLDFRDLSHTPVPLALDGWTVATLDSGEHHANAASGYNERRRETAAAAERLGVASLRDADAGAVDGLPEPLRSRARHVLEENGRVQDAVAALSTGDLPRLGELLDASHRSLRDLYAVSTPKVEAAVGRMRAAGAAGARIVGGGFGGNVLGLFAPNVQPPSGAVTVTPGPGARLLTAPRVRMRGR